MVVVLDAGHGGHDPGAVGPTGLCESEVTFIAASIMAEQLRSRGVTACMTRRDANYVPFQTRIEYANTLNADLFVSLHCNASHNRSANGSETYHFPGSKQGEIVAHRLQTALVQSGKRRDRGVKSGRFLVLRDTVMPAVLVELAFISHPEEEKLLADVGWLQRVCTSLARAVKP